MACRVFLFLLFNSNISSMKCGLCNGRFGVYSCTSVSTECVRIFGKDPIREIKVFRCGVKIVGEWSGQASIIRNIENKAVLVSVFFL